MIDEGARWARSGVAMGIDESATDDVPLVDDRAVDLEHDRQPVCRRGGPEGG
jgi:hypothetical protein